MGDDLKLPEKYQKLATEFAKLRAQNAVLKKAVIEGQDTQRSQEEKLKHREQAIRKYEQELDSLQFRNDQLSKRVGILQDELDQTASAKNKTSSKIANSNPFVDGVAAEDLQMKIEENERLQRELFESSQKHKAVVLDLQEKLKSNEKISTNHQRIVDENNEKHKIIVQKLQEEKAMLEARLQKCLEELKTISIKSEKSEQQAQVFNKKLVEKYETLVKIVAEKVNFNDTCFSSFNQLNIPSHDFKRQGKIKKLVSEALDLLRVFLAGLSDYHTYMEQRIRNLFEQPTDISRKLCEHLHQNATILRNIEESFNNFSCEVSKDVLLTLETAVGFKEFTEAFHKYSSYLQKIFSYQSLSTKEECSKSTCSSSMEKLSMAILHEFSKFVAVISELDTYLRLLASAGSEGGLLITNVTKTFALLDTTTQKIHTVLKGLSTAFYSKKMIEHQTPTITQTLKSTEECLETCLASLVTSSFKISNFLHSNIDFFSSRSSLQVRGVCADKNVGSPVVRKFREENKDYIAKLVKPLPKSIPYKLALENDCTLRSSNESRDTLTKQAALNLEKITKLEQEKEHWLLEAQLLQIKYEKEHQKAVFLQEEIENLQINRGVSISMKSDNPKTEEDLIKKPEEEIEKPVELGEMNVLHAVESPVSREDYIKEHYKKRMAELTSQLQLADSKAVFFHSECESLFKRLQMNINAQDESKKELAIAISRISELEDEVQMTKNSYQVQLDAMTDHLCGMSEKLTSQKDQIDALKTGKNKKGKNWFQSLKDKGNSDDIVE
ncbi:protein phosphatase 1 regulatory subunit 21-like [Xenia sp. Carnegie-2017]|uniref:protein phosphatase 1 regulatory subunit 21-like n=1 Tax=Xenia sp. Carnegie-2017 TaxID=2897299 RepID=UPI001F042D9D|nr:protein phosphatase 1 regulatory subunit 21-like [Xenia sp. Carnegie-2017]XP_046859325.1 protein phosphatase 1 regulatory subunit 21-like [Xenia sp. Carnegie-2017]